MRWEVHLICNKPIEPAKLVTTLKDNRNRVLKFKWGASSRWSFGPNSAWGSLETKTIGKTHLVRITFLQATVILVINGDNKKC